MLLAEAINVQRLNVPDLVVIEQQNLHNNQAVVVAKQQLAAAADMTSGRQHQLQQQHKTQPEAASLINDLTTIANSNVNSASQLEAIGQQQQLGNQITFECLISYDRKKDRNLIIKWHHDDRVEPIYQWIPELNKRSIAPQYRAFIAPIINSNNQQVGDATTTATNTGNGNQTQLLQAGFRLVRPTKEHGGE